MAATYIKNVALVGASGNCGSYIAQALLGTGKHTVTALTRAESKSSPPEGCVNRSVDYNEPGSLVAALRGQDALVITLSPRAASEQSKLIQAAADAGVPWILPNEWGTDHTNPKVTADALWGAKHSQTLQQIRDLGKSSYLAVCPGFWYEWSLSIPEAYGFDFANRSAVFFDDGNTPMTTSTWPQVGRTVASLLSLPVESPDGKTSLDSFRNQYIFVKSFTLTQKDMFESAKRVTGTQDSDWKITHEPSHERWSTYSAKFKAGDVSAFGPTLYTRYFFPGEEPGNSERHQKLSNDALGLPVEDLDQATRAAMTRQQAYGGKGYA